MLSFGIAVYAPGNTHPVSTFYRTLKPQEFKQRDAKTIDFWSKHPEQWDEVNRAPVDPREAFRDLSEWLKDLDAKVVWVAGPACFDWMFFKSYYEEYGPRIKYDIGFFCHCLTSLMRAYMLCHHVQDEAAFKAQLAGHAQPTHNALDDAKYQGAIYVNLRRLMDTGGLGALRG